MTEYQDLKAPARKRRETAALYATRIHRHWREQGVPMGQVDTATLQQIAAVNGVDSAINVHTGAVNIAMLARFIANHTPRVPNITTPLRVVDAPVYLADPEPAKEVEFPTITRAEAVAASRSDDAALNARFRALAEFLGIEVDPESEERVGAPEPHDGPCSWACRHLPPHDFPGTHSYESAVRSGEVNVGLVDGVAGTPALQVETVTYTDATHRGIRQAVHMSREDALVLYHQLGDLLQHG